MTLIVKCVDGEVRIEPKGYDLRSPYDRRQPTYVRGTAKTSATYSVAPTPAKTRRTLYIKAYVNADREQVEGRETMNRLEKWCQMCGAAPGEPCTVISGDPDAGEKPGDVRAEPHFYRSADSKPGVLIPDEPAFADIGPGAGE